MLWNPRRLIRDNLQKLISGSLAWMKDESFRAENVSMDRIAIAVQEIWGGTLMSFDHRSDDDATQISVRIGLLNPISEKGILKTVEAKTSIAASQVYDH